MVFLPNQFPTVIGMRHFSIVLWDDPNLKRIPWDDDLMKRWYDWETGEITEYSDESLKQYLKRGYVKREIALKTPGFIRAWVVSQNLQKHSRKCLTRMCHLY